MRELMCLGARPRQDFERDFNGDAIFEKSYMQCDCDNPIYTRLDEVTCGTIEKTKFPAFADHCPNVGQLLQVTKIECRFGHQFVLAEILPGGGNGTDAIVCTSPPYEFGVRVPLALTFNRVDFTPIESLSNCIEGVDPCTYFQYLAPKPEIAPAFQAPLAGSDAAVATLSLNFDEIIIKFSKPTDMGGQAVRQADLYGVNREYSGCVRYLTQETVMQLGSATMPKCAWSVGQDELIITVGDQPTFSKDTILYLTSDASMHVFQIHTSRLPLVLVPTSPDNSNFYDGALEAGAESRLRVRDGVITNEELEARGVEPIATDGTITDLDPLLGLELLPQLSYLFQPSTQCVETDEAGIETTFACPLRFRLELGQTGREDRPNVKIDGLGIVDACAESIVFDARRTTGDLGRAFLEAEWTLLETPPGVKLSTRRRLQNQLVDSFGGAMLQAAIVCNPSEVYVVDEELPGENDVLCQSLSFGRFKIGLNATSWVGLEGSGTFSFQRVSTAAGKVSISGDANKELTMGDTLRLYGKGDKSACVQEGEKVELLYRWTVAMPDHPGSDAEKHIQEAFTASRLPQDRMDLVVPPFALPFRSNHKYSFQLHLNQTYMGESFISRAHTVVRVESAKPVAVISGGSRTVSGTQDLTLVGTSSVDPNVPRAQQSSEGLVMCWSCALGTCNGKPCTGQPSAAPCPWNTTNASSWHISDSQLVLNGEYHVSLTAVRRQDLMAFMGKFFVSAPVSVRPCPCLFVVRDR